MREKIIYIKDSELDDFNPFNRHWTKYLDNENNIQPVLDYLFGGNTKDPNYKKVVHMINEYQKTYKNNTNKNERKLAKEKLINDLENIKSERNIEKEKAETKEMQARVSKFTDYYGEDGIEAGSLLEGIYRDKKYKLLFGKNSRSSKLYEIAKAAIKNKDKNKFNEAIRYLLSSLGIADLYGTSMTNANEAIRIFNDTTGVQFTSMFNDMTDFRNKIKGLEDSDNGKIIKEAMTDFSEAYDDFITGSMSEPNYRRAIVDFFDDYKSHIALAEKETARGITLNFDRALRTIHSNGGDIQYVLFDEGVIYEYCNYYKEDETKKFIDENFEVLRANFPKTKDFTYDPRDEGKFANLAIVEGKKAFIKKVISIFTEKLVNKGYITKDDLEKFNFNKNPVNKNEALESYQASPENREKYFETLSSDLDNPEKFKDVFDKYKDKDKLEFTTSKDDLRKKLTEEFKSSEVISITSEEAEKLKKLTEADKNKIKKDLIENADPFTVLTIFGEPKGTDSLNEFGNKIKEAWLASVGDTSPEEPKKEESKETVEEPEKSPEETKKEESSEDLEAKAKELFESLKGKYDIQYERVKNNPEFEKDLLGVIVKQLKNKKPCDAHAIKKYIINNYSSSSSEVTEPVKKDEPIELEESDENEVSESQPSNDTGKKKKSNLKRNSNAKKSSKGSGDGGTGDGNVKTPPTLEEIKAQPTIRNLLAQEGIDTTKVDAVINELIKQGKNKKEIVESISRIDPNEFKKTEEKPTEVKDSHEDKKFNRDLAEACVERMLSENNKVRASDIKFEVHKEWRDIYLKFFYLERTNYEKFKKLTAKLDKLAANGKHNEYVDAWIDFKNYRAAEKDFDENEEKYKAQAQSKQKIEEQEKQVVQKIFDTKVKTEFNCDGFVNPKSSSINVVYDPKNPMKDRVDLIFGAAYSKQKNIKHLMINDPQFIPTIVEPKLLKIFGGSALNENLLDYKINVDSEHELITIKISVKGEAVRKNLQVHDSASLKLEKIIFVKSK